MEARGSLRIAAELENLIAIHDFVRESAAALDVDEATIPDLLLAADEAVTNVIVHGYRGQAGEIEIEVKREGTDIVICIRDSAPPFDPTSAPAPDLDQPLDQRAPGGLGIFLMRQYMDETMHRTTAEGGNELILKKTAPG